VGGPSGNDSYNDSHLNWQQNEVALDYNAPYQSLLAYKIMYDMSDSVDEPNSPLPKNRNRDDNESGQKTLPKWVLPVAVTLSVLAFIAIIALVWKLYSRRKIHARNKGVMTATNDVSSNQLGNGSPQSLQLSLSFGSTLRG
jgi:endoglucanase